MASPPAQAQMDWLKTTLAAQKAAGGRVWMVHHIPWGIDPYSTEHSKADTCPARVVPFMKDDFAAEFLGLIRQYADIIDMSVSGHVHFDDYRLLLDDAGKPHRDRQGGAGDQPDLRAESRLPDVHL